MALGTCAKRSLLYIFSIDAVLDLHIYNTVPHIQLADVFEKS
jgi:hypothetical protein